MVAYIGLDIGDNVNLPILVSELVIGSFKSRTIRVKVC